MFATRVISSCREYNVGCCCIYARAHANDSAQSVNMHNARATVFHHSHYYYCIVCLVVFCFVSSFLAYLLSLVRLCSNLWFIHCGWLKCAHTMAERARAMSDYGVSAARPVRSDVRNFFPQSHWIFNSFFFFFLLFLLLFLCSFITYIHYFFFIHHSAALIFIHHTCNSVNVCPSVRCVLCVRVRVQWY